MRCHESTCGPLAPVRQAGAFGWIAFFSLLGCGQAIREPSAPPERALEDPSPAATAPSKSTTRIRTEPSSPLEAEPGTQADGPRCVMPMQSGPEAFPASAQDCPDAPSQHPPLAVGSLRFPDAPSAPVIQVERAETQSDRMLGLMYRTALDEDAGMLFSWPSESPRSFWMRNTCIPLDMLFIDRDGYIVGILEQVPTLNELPRRVPCPASRVLEVNAGFSRHHGIEPGQRISVDF